MPPLVALPVVAVLWVAVGLPVLSQVTGAAASNRLSRGVAFATQAAGAGGSSAGGSSAPQTVAAATVSRQVLAAYHAEVAQRARVRTAAAATSKAKARLDLPQLTLPSAPAGTATLATVDAPSSPPTPSQQSAPPPANDNGQDPGSSGGSGGSSDKGGATTPGTGSGGSTPPVGSGSGDTGGSSDSGGSSTGGTDTGDTGDIGGSGGSGGTGGTPPPPPPPPAPPTPPPPPPPAPPTPPPPPAFPAPADIQTWSGGGPHKPTAGDAMLFVFASAPDPAAILPGWNGSGTAVTFQINDNGTSDVVTVLSSGGSQLTALGSVSLGGDYANQQNVTASGSTMFVWGNMVIVVLGTPSGKTINQTNPGTMVWTAPTGSATESGAPDSEF